MEVFILFFLLLLFGIIFDAFLHKQKFQKKYGVMLGIFLMFLSAFRNESVGIDTKGTYLFWFQRISQLNWDEMQTYFYKDWTFWYGNKLLSLLTKEYQYLLGICACASLFLIIRYIYKYSSDDILTYFIFVGCGYFALGMNMIRQYMAMAICIYAFDYIIKQEKKMFLLMVIFAASIHVTAIFFLPAYFVAYNKMKAKNIICYLIFIAFSVAAGYYLLLLVTNIFFAGYYQPQGFGEDEGGKATLFMVLTVLSFGILNLKNIVKRNEKNIVYYNLLWLALLIQVQAVYMSNVSRVGYYYNFFVILFIPEIIKSVKNKLLKQCLYYSMIVISLVVYFFKMYNLNGVYPYLFFWE